MSVVENSSVASVAARAALADKSQWLAMLCGCVVGFAYSANYTNHAPLAPALMHEFGFNQALAGFLTTGIFATHAAGQIPGGHLVDRLGAKRVLLCALIWVMLCNLGLALAGAYWQLLLLKIVTGMGTGICFVGGARYVHAAASRTRMNLAQGLFGGSVQLGAGFVILAVPRLNLLAGWRATFLVSAGMALAAAIIWTAAAPNVRSGAAPPGRFGEMLWAPQLWLLGLVQMASFGLSIIVGSWVVVLLIKVLKVPATQAGLIGSLVLLLGIISRPLGGILRRHLGIRTLFISSMLMIALGCFAFVTASISYGVAVTAVVLIGIGVGLPYAAMFSRAGALFPGRAGAAMGLVNMLGILMILGGAPLVGHLADLSGNFRVSFVVLGAFALLVCAAVIPFIQSAEPTIPQTRA
jgi:MFS family permease